MFARLVRALEADGVSVFAHIDAKAEQTLFTPAGMGKDIRFVLDRIRVNRGGYSQVDAMLRLLRLAANHGPHDYYIFLSGRDYPLKSNYEIADFLQLSAGRSYINFYPLVEGTAFVEKIRTYCFYDAYARLGHPLLRKSANRAVRILSALVPARRFLDGFVPYRGSTSWCLSQPLVTYILEFVSDARNSLFLQYFRSVYGCDEIFFQTIVLNSPLAPTCAGYDEDIRNKRPGDMKNENKVYLHYIDWSPERENPALLDLRDLPALAASDKFFSRKFDSQKSSRLLDKLDSLRGPVAPSK